MNGLFISNRFLFPLSGRNRGRRSSALVITLAALVLVSAIILVFFQASAVHRQMSFSSAGLYRADLTAHNAMDTILGDLRTEIAAGSTIYTSNSIPVYIPSANSTAVPSPVYNQGFVNLIAQSAGTSNFWSGAGYDGTTNPTRSLANNSTATASLNGRSITQAEWNRPGLLGDPGSGITYPSGPSAAYVPPDWVIVTRQGPIANGTATIANLSNKAASNPSYAVGRYAYTIYNEGGLLDINVAGFPNSVHTTDDFATKRGLLAQIDLNNLVDSNGNKMVADADSLVRWRNAGTVQSPLNYTNYVLNTTNGFIHVAKGNEVISGNGTTYTVPSPGDQAFISRQDLIQYSQANSDKVSTSALQYLGTFSRQLNAPSYTPPSARSKVQAGYAAVGMDDQFNPSLLNTRVTGSFLRDDGTTAQVGESLIKYRFPLSRLALVTDAATATTSDPIYKYFGLTRSSAGAPWVYRNGATTIQKLASLAGTREPDFFELLQAAINVGSLGQGLTNSFANCRATDIQLYRQIIQIGANLIDQYDSDSYPTRITFNSEIFSGSENLPYLTRVFETYYSPLTSGQYSAWYQPEVWNPYVGTTGSAGPTTFRFLSVGKAEAHFYNPGAEIHTSSNPFNAPTGLVFSQNFSNPTLLSPASCTASGNDLLTPPGIAGIWIGTIGGTPHTIPIPYQGAYTIQNVTHHLQYLRGVTWIDYDLIRNVNGMIYNTSPGGFYLYQNVMYSTRSDPRTDRFGVLGGYIIAPDAAGQSIRPTTGTGAIGSTGFSPDPFWSVTGPYPGVLSENSAASVLHYADPDKTIRRAEGADVNGSASGGGYPLATDAVNNPSSRPVILNRPFRSVAEMGYAFRDEPWKNLDFFTSESADSALLDCFCLNESPPPSHPTISTDAEALAGSIDLNTRQVPVLRAVLQGEGKANELTTTLSSSEASALASNLVALSTAQPLLNRAELVTRWISAASIGGIFPATADGIIKRRREAAIRALADIGNTRTWNLLIDVIAQSGRYPSTAADLNSFLVEGERRYWLHVAIDRYTGKVVAQSLEPVTQ